MEISKSNKYEKMIEDHIKELVPLDNDAFAYFATKKEFCQEFLRVVLEDDKLEVLENEPQKFLPNVYFKASIIDMLCKLGDERIVNVEVQLYEEKEHARRIFQYASMIRQAFVEKGEEYSKIKEIIIIYLTKEDIFKKGNTIYDVDMSIISDTKEFISKWDCGLKIKYINTEGITNKEINEYLKLLTDNKTYNSKYPEAVKIKKEILEVGGKYMSMWFQNLISNEKDEWIKEGMQQGMERGIEQGMQQGKADVIASLIKNGVITKEEADKQLALMK